MHTKLSREKTIFLEQLLPLGLTVVVCACLVVALFFTIRTLNLFTRHDIVMHLRIQDILVGLTIYLKTSVDFALLIGNLMSSYKGWKNRIAIEVGTAVGNAVGTLLVLSLWTFFKDIKILLAAMITLASLVLLRLAEDGLEHALSGNTFSMRWAEIIHAFDRGLKTVNEFFAPALSRIIPNVGMKPTKGLTIVGLLSVSFTVPFILGLDDFAGYVPLFNIVNVFGFATGVFIGHMILNAFLFLNPKVTIQIVKNSIISLIGSVVFVALGLWGFHEAYKLLFH